jgi:hypothetical protein
LNLLSQRCSGMGFARYSKTPLHRSSVNATSLNAATKRYAVEFREGDGGPVVSARPGFSTTSAVLLLGAEHGSEGVRRSNENKLAAVQLACSALMGP